MKFRLMGAALSLLACTAFALTQSAPKAAPHLGKSKKTLLVVTVTKGFRHSDSIPIAEQTIEELGKTGKEWETDFVRTDDDMKTKMTASALKKYDAIVFANTTGDLPLPDPQAFLDYIKAGHGFAAMHSGSDTLHKWPGSSSAVSEYIEMLGGEFLTHHSQCAVMAKIEDPTHPALKPLATLSKEKLTATEDLKEKEVRASTATDGKTWKVFDEIYLLKNNDRKNLHVLLSLDAYPNDGSSEANHPGEHLLSWVKSYGKGRVFYTELGHRPEVWRDPLYRNHIKGGLEFVLGLSKGSVTPN